MAAETLSISRRIYEYIQGRGLEPGTLYRLDQMEADLGISLKRSRSAIYSATRLLEKLNKRTLVCVVNQGYRIAEPREVPDLAAARLKRAKRQVSAGARTADSQDLVFLTPQERREGDLTRQAMHFMVREFRRVDAQLKRHENLISEVSDQAQDQDERLRRLEAELAALRESR